MYALVPVHRRLWAMVQTERGRGPIAIAWGSPHVPPPPDNISALEVLEGLLRGRLSALDIPALAASMRYDKHRDPLKGIIAAYLYDSIGDIENIRRMCWYYADAGQDVPFDIALLARIPFQRRGRHLFVKTPRIEAGPEAKGPTFTWEATPGGRVQVAGRAPLMRAGWSKLHQIGPWGQSLLEFADTLTANPIATFRGKTVGRRLAELI